MSNYLKKESSLTELITKLNPVDLVLVEGWKKENIKKIEVYRKEINKPLLALNDKNIIAIATNDKNINIDKVIALDINNYDSIAKFIEKLIKKKKLNDAINKDSQSYGNKLLKLETVIKKLKVILSHIIILKQLK